MADLKVSTRRGRLKFINLEIDPEVHRKFKARTYEKGHYMGRVVLALFEMYADGLLDDGEIGELIDSAASRLGRAPA